MPADIVNKPLTIEVWLRQDAMTDYGVIWSLSNDVFCQNTAGKTVCFCHAAGWVGYSKLPLVPIGSYSHLAMSHDGSTYSFFLNGKLALSWTDPGFMVDGTPSKYGGEKGIWLGGVPSGRSNEQWIGTFDEVRISSGARYTQDFVPPAHLTADASTLMLYLFDRPGPGPIASDLPGVADAQLGGNPLPSFVPVSR